MRNELTTLSQSLDIPLAYGALVVVPNITQGRNSLIYRKVCRYPTDNKPESMGKKGGKESRARRTCHTTHNRDGFQQAVNQESLGRGPATLHLH